MSVNLTKNTGAQSAEVPPLSKGEKRLLAGAVLFGGGVGGIGLVSSFGTVAAAAERWGFGIPELLPVGIDIAIPVFTVANLLLIRMGMPLGWVRFVPWVLTLVTCWLNVAAGHGLSAKIAHGTMPLLWVVLSEIAAHVYAVRIGKATGQRMERIRLSRWLLAPVPTFALWRRMVLWETTCYRDALAREKERQLARADLREEHGRGWRRKAPRRTRVLLKLGELAPEDAAQAPVPELEPPKPTPEPEPADPEQAAKPAARRPAKPRQSKTGRKPARSFEQLLTEARSETKDWTPEELKAEPIRGAVGCGQDRARKLRDVLKAERDVLKAERGEGGTELKAVAA